MRKEELGKNPGGGYAIEEKVIPLDGGADRAGNHRLHQQAPLRPCLRRCRRHGSNLSNDYREDEKIKTCPVQAWRLPTSAPVSTEAPRPRRPSPSARRGWPLPWPELREAATPRRDRRPKAASCAAQHLRERPL